jgi:hypothetical protein
MGSPLLPLALALGALGADSAGFHELALYVVLLAVAGAGAAAFVSAGELLEGKGSVLRAASTGVALVLLVVGSAVRANAVVGSHLPTVALSSVVIAVIVYLVPALAWLLRAPAPRTRPAQDRSVLDRPLAGS